MSIPFQGFITDEEWIYFERTFSEYSNVLRWLELLRNDVQKVSACWNLKRDHECKNCNVDKFKKFLRTLDEELKKIFENIPINDVSKIPPYVIFKDISTDRYCIITDDLRDTEIIKDKSCSGMGQCSFTETIESIPFKGEKLCRVVEDYTFVFQYNCDGNTTGEAIYKLINDIKNRDIKNYTHLKCKVIGEKIFWVTRYSDYDRIRKDNDGDLATTVRNYLGLEHFRDKEMILIIYPEKDFHIRKIGKPTSTLAPTVPFRVECSKNKWGKTIRLDTAEEAANEAVICPHDLEPFLFEFDVIGKPLHKPFDFYLHNEKVKYY